MRSVNKSESNDRKLTPLVSFWQIAGCRGIFGESTATDRRRQEEIAPHTADVSVALFEFFYSFQQGPDALLARPPLNNVRHDEKH